MAIKVKKLVCLFRRWLREKVRRGQRKKRTLDYYMQLHDKFLAKVGDVDCGELRAWDLVGWAHTWHQVQAVQRLFSWAQKAQLCPTNPFAGVDRPPPGERERTLSRLELVRLMRRSTAPFRALLVFLNESIARPQEARGMEWCNRRTLTDDGQYFVLADYKGKQRRRRRLKARVIPITPRLSRLLERLQRRGGKADGKILLNSRKKPWTANAIRCAMRSARRRAKLGPDEAGEQVVCYSLRHTCATRLTSHGIGLKPLSELMGHASTRQTERYVHLHVEELLAAFRQAT
jgi:integrase